MESQNNIKVFLEGFRNYYSTVERFKIESDRAIIQGLLSGWKALALTIADYEKRTASSYNIFYILKGISNSEVITHTPFIADLLNIHGKHKQGDLFYLEFLDQLKLRDKEKFIADKKILFSIDEPKYIGPIDKDYIEGGFIDILIGYRDAKTHFAIAIENKRDAPDQPKQLLRYYKYLKDVYKNNYLLVYLSPYGQDPAEHSIDKTLLNTLIQQDIIRVISYERIKSLLRNTINKVEARNVHSLLNQYLEII
jgi:hypothetical protein